MCTFMRMMQLLCNFSTWMGHDLTVNDILCYYAHPLGQL